MTTNAEWFQEGCGVEQDRLADAQAAGDDRSAISSLRRIAEIGDERGVDIIFCMVSRIVGDADFAASENFRTWSKDRQAMF